jgi:hypothetical protein
MPVVTQPWASSLQPAFGSLGSQVVVRQNANAEEAQSRLTKNPVTAKKLECFMVPKARESAPPLR